MTLLRNQLSQVIEKNGFSKWGIADIDGLHPLAVEFPKALSIALSYEIPFENYDEPSCHVLTIQVRDAFDRKLEAVVEFLRENNVKHLIPIAAPQGSGKNVPVFPHKMTATRAGLGWIGKSTLLVTPEFGPRVRLGTILLAADLDVDVPVTVSRCGECDICSAACPNDAVSNVLWSPVEGMVPLFSAINCGKREVYVETIGRKHSCGLCLLACPVGNI